MQARLYAGPGMIAEFHEWLDKASHGDALIYHVGDLQFDRQVRHDPNDPEQREDFIKVSVLDAVATSILVEAGNGRLTMTQRRIDENLYEYRAHRVRVNEARRHQASLQSDARRPLTN